MRSRDAELVWLQVANYASTFGITRVTDVTRLDRVGVPVCVAVRPRGQQGSLCVHAGKGLHIAEARVGAFMEAVEYSCMEFNPARHELEFAPIQDVVNQLGVDFFDLTPRFAARISPRDLVACYRANDVTTGESVRVPAEMVFLPFGQAFDPDSFGPFGTRSSGCAVGRTVAEAAVHGLCELMERDIQSFEPFGSAADVVDLSGYAGEALPAIEAIRAAGLVLTVNTSRNRFGLPYFRAIVAEADIERPIGIACGFGFHLSREVALLRAVTEAIQSRLSWIHGGRDDLMQRVNHFEKYGGDMESRNAFMQRSRSGAPVSFFEVADGTAACSSAVDALSTLLSCLKLLGHSRVLAVDLGVGSFPFTVQKYIVPGLEDFEPVLKRMGRRLLRPASVL
jgi:ribosomal protein S12 methylthiotransferase accessory factor